MAIGQGERVFRGSVQAEVCFSPTLAAVGRFGCATGCRRMHSLLGTRKRGALLLAISPCCGGRTTCVNRHVSDKTVTAEAFLAPVT